MTTQICYSDVTLRKNTTGVHETEERKQCLDLAQEAGLDVSRITKLVVENIRNRDRMDFQTDSEMPLDTGITEV